MVFVLGLIALLAIGPVLYLWLRGGLIAACMASGPFAVIGGIAAVVTMDSLHIPKSPGPPAFAIGLSIAFAWLPYWIAKERRKRAFAKLALDAPFIARAVRYG